MNDVYDEMSLRARFGRLEQAPCPIYIGVKVNRKRGVCKANEAYVVQSTGTAAESGLGCVLSRDVLSDTGNCLQALADRESA